MAFYHGIKVTQQATAVSTPNVADSGVPFVVGTAPVHAASNPGRTGAPVLCTSWDEAVEKLGFSYDWKKYTLCEFMYSHFQLYGRQPVIFCNVLDPEKHKEAMDAQDYDVKDHRVTLPYDVIGGETLVVKAQGEGDTYTADSDYTVFYDSDAGACVVELLSTGKAYGAEQLNIAGARVKTEDIKNTDIVAGLGKVDACVSTVAMVPDLICAPGWSQDSTVAAVMATKAEAINSLFSAKALIDLDCGAEGVGEYSAAAAWKTEHNLVDPVQIPCWPMQKNGDYMFHMSTQLAGLMAQVDADNGGTPVESPSGKSFKMTGACLEDGTEVDITLEQANILNANGIVTCLNFLSTGWVCWGNYTACYPANTDIKDQYIPVSRMFGFVGNTLVKTFWSKLDKPMTRLLLDNIRDSANIWLDGLTGAGRLLGGRVEILEAENPLTDLMAGIIRVHIFIAPPVPAQEIEFFLEFDVSYIRQALAA